MRALSEKEEMVMHALWSIKKGFVKEILENMPGENHYNTVSSTVRKLQQEGYIDHETIGKSHQYFPTIKKKAYKQRLFKHLKKNYFSSSKEKMFGYFIETEKIDLKKLEKLVKAQKKKK